MCKVPIEDLNNLSFETILNEILVVREDLNGMSRY